MTWKLHIKKLLSLLCLRRFRVLSMEDSHIQHQQQENHQLFFPHEIDSRLGT